ncbi:hypothetical protein [Sphingobacterium lactis]|uniref:Uncharacterized protein n=1 Tax=Sphingobacterium lactis TaxID=797291 RepID=A0A1H6CRU7_9SPHI|nr:hypothetical protein [Sphingobacterium lactis]SEG75704.1 hypothetical protein SAMN05421877_11939 [Sphingobacterium lactis]
MRGIKILAMACLVCVLASCGSLRNKSKSSEKLEIIEGAKLQQTATEQSGSKVAITEREVDKGTVVTERTTTTTTNRDGAKGTAVIRKGDLKPGENTIPMDSALGLIKAVLDTLNQTLTIEVTTPAAKSETVITERITERKDVDRERKEERQDTSSKQVATQVQSDRRESASGEENESKPNIWAVLVSKIGWGIAGVILIGFVLWYLFRRK